MSKQTDGYRPYLLTDISEWLAGWREDIRVAQQRHPTASLGRTLSAMDAYLILYMGLGYHRYEDAVAWFREHYLDHDEMDAIVDRWCDEVRDYVWDVYGIRYDISQVRFVPLLGAASIYYLLFMSAGELQQQGGMVFPSYMYRSLPRMIDDTPLIQDVADFDLF